MKKIIFLIILFTFSACELELEHANPLDNLELTTGSTQEIGTSSCKVQGTITTNELNGVDDYGHCWSQENNPTISDAITSFGDFKGKETFISEINNLAVNTSYYIRAYAKANDTILYAESISIETEWALDVPLIETGGVNLITSSSANAQGDIMEQGMSSVTKYGHCWSTSTSPTISDNNLEVLGGSTIDTFSTPLTGLSNNTKYYYRAYAQNSQGLAYGSEQSFSTTNGEPTVITGGISNISTTSITLEGEITGIGDAPITQHGHCWSTTPNPNINNTSPSTGGNTTLGTFTSSVTNLNTITTYYYKAYATNSFGTAYGEQSTFTTSDGSPIVETGGHVFTGWYQNYYVEYTFTAEVLSYGSAPITSLGIAYSSFNNEPTYGWSLSPVIQNGVFTVDSYYQNLSTNSIYYYRSYAENAFGRSYGDTKSFRTPERCSNINDPTNGAPSITTSLNSTNTTVTVNVDGFSGTNQVDEVYLYQNNTFITNFGSYLLFTNGQRTFTLPSDLDVSDCYTVQISDGGNGSILMVSDPFTVE